MEGNDSKRRGGICPQVLVLALFTSKALFIEINLEYILSVLVYSPGGFIE